MDKKKEAFHIEQGGGKSYTLDEYCALIEPQYREHKAAIQKCIAGLTEYAARLAAQHQEEQLPQLRRLCIEMAEFWGLTDEDAPKGYQDRAVPDAGSSGQAVNEQTKKDILEGLELYAQEMTVNGDMEQRVMECDLLAEQLQVEWQSNIVENCIRGLTVYAAGLAEDEQERGWLRTLIEDMTEFFGLEAPEQYLAAFEKAVSDSSGQAVLSEQSKLDILAGLEQYTAEMQANGENQEPWFIACTGFMNGLQEQWQPDTGMEMRL